MNIYGYGSFLATLFYNLTISILIAAEPFKPLCTETPPVIDGLLNDQVWTVAPHVTDFQTFMPDYGKAGSQKTIAYMAYDNENLYFAFRCYDSEPNKIKTSIASRDKIIPDDWVCINLDSFNDQQALTAFYINPMGIQADSRFAAGNEDFNIDLVWYSAGKSDSTGYTIEIQLPLKSLRYSNREPVEMGIFFERYISRLSEHSSYPPMDPARGQAFLTQMHPMIYTRLKHYTLFELLPAVTYSSKLKLEKDNLVKEEQKPNFSLTTKYGITSDLIADGTLNPDFSQVEADAGQVDVNLRYALYYSEKRPFFLEGNENFRIAATQASELDPVVSIVHTRTIVNPITGIKLTGKLSENNTIASVYALDELPDEMREFGRYAHVPIVRIKSALSEDSYIGGIFAGTEMNHRFNRVAGVDEMYRLGNATMIESHALVSQTKTSESASTHLGHAIGISGWRMTRDLDWGVTFKDLSEDFSADMGYVSRASMSGTTGIIRPKFYPQSEIVRRIDAEFFTGWTMDKPSNMWETFNHLSLQHFLFGALTLKIKYSYSTEIFNGVRFNTGGFHVLGGGQFTKELNLSVLYRRINAVYYSVNPYQGKSNRITATIVFQPYDQLSFESAFIFYDFYRTSDNKKMYEYPIVREKLTYQLNKYTFFRGITEYNRYKNELLIDFLASFTYIPGTVIHLGYGALYEKIRWDGENLMYLESRRFLETKRGFFFKMSYLWRM